MIGGLEICWLFPCCQTGNVSYALTLSQELLHYGTVFFFFYWNCPLLLILILLHKHFPKTPLYRLSLCEQCDMSLWLHYIYFFSDPMNGRVLQNVEKYEKLLVAASPPRVSGFRRPTTKYVRTRDTYERLCQTQGSQVFTTIHHSRHIPCVKIMHGRKKGEVYVTASVRNQQRKNTKQLQQVHRIQCLVTMT